MISMIFSTIVGVFLLALVGAFQVISWIVGSSRKTADLGLSSREKLEVTSEILGDRLPENLQAELAKYQLRAKAAPWRATERAGRGHGGQDVGDGGSVDPKGPIGQSALFHPASPEAESLAAPTALPSPQEISPPTTSADLAIQDNAAEGDNAAEQEKEKPREDAYGSELGDIMNADLMVPVPGGSLYPDPKFEAMGQYAHFSLKAFLSFENIIFLLATVLFMGAASILRQPLGRGCHWFGSRSFWRGSPAPLAWCCSWAAGLCIADWT